MKIIFWVIVALTALLLSQNARYAARTYLANRQKMIFTFYFGLLIALGTLIMHVTSKTFSIVQDARDSNVMDF